MSSYYGQGSSNAWRRTRAAVLRRDHHRCQLRIPGICTGVATECDHITNLASTHTRRRDASDPAQCQAVCRACHAAKTQQECREGKRRRRSAAPVKHPGLITP